MAIDYKIFVHLRLFLSSKPYQKEENIHLYSKLEKELNLFGDEAYEFLDDYSQEFKVNIDNFPFEDYFTKETAFYFIYQWFPAMNKKKKELTVEDLYNGIVKKILE